MLAWQPGRLTRDYIDGKRIRHISPVALFLFSVFLMFAVVKSIGGSAGDGSGGITVNTEIGTGLSRIDADLARLERERATLAAQGRNPAALETELAEQRAARSGLAELAAGRLPIGKAGSDIPALDRALKAFAQNPSLLLYKLQANTYKFSWALIPISALFVWLLFPFSKRFGAYDHTVFVTYSLSFMALLVALLTIVEALGLSVAWLAMIAVPPLHMYRQLRGTYGLSRAAAAWRTVALAIFALLALALFGMLMLAKSG